MTDSRNFKIIKLNIKQREQLVAETANQPRLDELGDIAQGLQAEQEPFEDIKDRIKRRAAIRRLTTTKRSQISKKTPENTNKNQPYRIAGSYNPDADAFPVESLDKQKFFGTPISTGKAGVGDIVRGFHLPSQKNGLIDMMPAGIVPENKPYTKSESPPTNTYGLIASANNYITGGEWNQPYREAEIMAALFAQMLSDTKGWVFKPTKKTKRTIALLKGPTYTPLYPIQLALSVYGYQCVVVPNFNWKTISNCDMLIARIVTVTNQLGETGNNPSYCFSNGVSPGGASFAPKMSDFLTWLPGLKMALTRKKLVWLGGCGCPYGSHALNYVLQTLGLPWRLTETRCCNPSIAAEKPWSIQKIKINDTIIEPITYNPHITDSTAFSFAEKDEILVRSANQLPTILYSPYPKCIRW